MPTIRMRRDYVANWVSRNPMLAQGEPGFEVDTRKIKVGDGVHRWNDLEYVASDSDSAGPLPEGDLLDHVNAELPHPVYDDGPSLDLLYQNAKV